MKKILITLGLIGLFLFTAYPSEATFWLRGRLLKTGQTTSYAAGDDGDLQKGLAKSYTVLSTGQYSGTTNIDLAHYTSGAGAITFNNTAKTIVDTGTGLAIFKTNDVIMTSSASNPGPFTVTTGNVAGTITATGATFVDETPAGAVTFYKRESHSNNVVLDNNTGLMWSRYVSGSMGLASDGKMPWSGGLYNIYQYVAAANSANLAGHNDWRVPNWVSLASLLLCEPTNGSPYINVTVFPSFPGTDIWSSSTALADDTRATTVTFDSGLVRNAGVTIKTTGAIYVLLVRGGN